MTLKKVLFLLNLPMQSLTFEVSGIPQGKGAARHTSRGFTYTPAKTRDYMEEVRMAAKLAGAQSLDLPCTMIIKAHFPIPTSYPKKLQETIRNGEFYYIKKPDTDNLSKIKDALIGVAFTDDALVFQEEVIKYYSDRPRLEITIFYHPVPNSNMLGFRV